MNATPLLAARHLSSSQKKKRNGVILAASIALLLSPSVQAVNLYWDADGSATTATGGTGVWDASSSLWRADSATGTLQAYANTASTGTATFAGTSGTVTIAADTAIYANYLSFAANGYLLTGSNSASVLNLDGTAPTISVTSGTARIGATVAGSGGLNKIGSSLLWLMGTNTYSGTTTIAAGTLRADEGVGLGSGALLLANGTLETGADFTRSLGSGAGQVQLSASGSNISTGFSAYGAPVTVAIGGTASPAALTWGSANFSPATGTGAFVLNASSANNALTFLNSIDLNNTASAVTRTISVGANVATITGTLSNSNAVAGLTKTGAGTLVLTAANTYSGTTTISAGILRANEGVGLGSGNLLLAGGALEISSDFTRSLGMGAGQVQLTASSADTGFSAYGNDVVVAVGGTASPTALAWGANSFMTTSGRALTLNASTATNTLTFLNSIDLNTSTSATNTRTIAVNSGTAVVSGNLTQSGTTTGLTKSGAGVLVLAGDNTYAGTTTISGGILRLGSSTALQNTSGISVGNSTALDLNGYALSSGTVVLSFGSAAALQNSSTNSVILENPLNFTTTNTAYISNISTIGTVTLAGTITSAAAAVQKTNTGNIILSGSNAFGGNFIINNGGVGIANDHALDGATTLKLDCNNSLNVISLWAEGGARTISNTVTVNVNSNSYGAVVFTGTNDLTFSGTYGNIYASGGGSGMAINNTGVTTFSGVIQLAVGASAVATLYIRGMGDVLVSGTVTDGVKSGGALVYAGPGNLTLSASNSFTSALRVNGGTVRVTGLNTTGTNSVSISSGTLSLDLSGGNDRWNTQAPVVLNGGSLLITGAASGASSQTLGSLTTGTGRSTITVDKNTGSGTTLTLGSTWARSAGGSLLIDLSSGGVLNASPTAVTNGVISSGTGSGVFYAIVKDADGYGFASTSGGTITRYTGANTLTASSSTSTTNYEIVANDDSLFLTNGAHTIGSLQIDTASGDGLLNIGQTADGQLSLTYQALLMTGANDFTITSGTLGASTKELLVHQYGSGVLTINSTIGATSGGLTKSGDGLLILGGTQTYNGKTVITAGALQANEGAGLSGSSALQLAGGVLQTTGTFSRAIGTSAGSVYWDANNSGGFAASSGTLAIQLNGGTSALQWNSTSFLLDGKALLLGSTSADGLVDFQNSLDLGTVAYSGATREIKVVDNTASAFDRARISGVIFSTGSDIGLLKTGDGILELMAANTYDGATYVHGGTLSVSSLSNGGIASNIGASGAGSENLQIDGGTFQYTGAAASTDRLFSTGVNGATIDASGSGALHLTNTGAMGFVGDRTSSRTLTLTGTNRGANTLSASISNPTTSGSTSVAKTGVGTWVLDGASSYTGKTTVSEGKLIVSGSLSATKAVDVAEGAELNVKGLVNHGAAIALSGRLSGDGSVGTVNVSDTGVVNPGADGIGSIGTLFTQGLSLSSLSVVNFDLSTTDHTAGSGINDLIAVTGDLRLDGLLNISSTGTLTEGTYTLFTFTGTLDNQTITLSSSFLSFYAGSYINATDSAIELVIVPEPGSWAMLLGGAGLLVFWQRARRRAAGLRS